MALIDLQTDLKSLKYGKDRIGGGSSNQPFVQKPIPDSFSAVGNTGGLDVLTRGGSLAFSSTADDVSRLTKLLLSGNTFQGPFFTIKQNTLSNQSVRTQGSTDRYNQGAYSPVATISQAGLSFLQGHQELFESFQPYSIAVPVKQDDDQNRLIGLYRQNFTDNPLKVQDGLRGFQSTTGNLLEYKGGPGASLTGGKTLIRFADQRTPRPAADFPDLSRFKLTVTVPASSGPGKDQVQNGLGLIPLDHLYLASAEAVSRNSILFQQTRGFLTSEDLSLFLPENSQNFRSQQKDILQFSKGGTKFLLSYDQILQSVPYGSGSVFVPDDFRLKTNLKNQAPTGEFTLDKIFLIGDPGYRDINRNIDPSSAVEKNPNTTDLINFTLIQNGLKPENANDDLIPFYIGVYGYGTSGDQSVQFRAFLNSFNDTFNGEWNAFRYMGRGENFYTYDGFSREISLTFSVHAQSKAELLRQYTRLNFLASLLAPNYSGAGFMRGNFLTLTVGDYLIEVPGILTNLSYTIPTESPWDIGRKNDGTRTNYKDRLPHLIEVNTFSFKPIHNFIPAKGKPFISAVS